MQELRPWQARRLLNKRPLFDGRGDESGGAATDVGAVGEEVTATVGAMGDGKRGLPSLTSAAAVGTPRLLSSRTSLSRRPRVRNLAAAVVKKEAKVRCFHQV